MFGGQLPIADDGGGCNDANFVEFEDPVPAKQGGENACARGVESLESQCTSVFGWERFSDQLYVATDGTVAPASAIITEDYIPVRREAELSPGGGEGGSRIQVRTEAGIGGGVGWGVHSGSCTTMLFETIDPCFRSLVLFGGGCWGFHRPGRRTPLAPQAPGGVRCSASRMEGGLLHSLL